MSPTLGWLIIRLARIRCPIASVGSIDPLGILYGLTMNAWTRKATATATATVATSSTMPLTCTSAPTGALENPDAIGGPIGEECAADDPGTRDRAPEPAVVGLAAVVAHHVVIAGRNG